MAVKPSFTRARQRSIPRKRNLASLPSGTETKGSRGSGTMGSSATQVGGDENWVDQEIVSPMIEASLNAAPFFIDDLYKSEGPIRDALVSKTSVMQDWTVRQCIPLLSTTETRDGIEYDRRGLPRLHRQKHINFLVKSLGKLPPQSVMADASRPWSFYWALNGMSLLGANISSYRDRLVATARHIQNPTGGFGGGFGQISHLACTYALVLALTTVGGESAYEAIDRRAMWIWLCSLKQPNGGFQMCRGGEIDVRGAYCATVVISLLNLPLELDVESPARKAGLEGLHTGLKEYVRKCQTFEGGIACKPDAEAHGAYAFCALACLSILGAPRRIIPQVLDVPRLVSWLSSRQYAPEAGFSGRTNKLVDGCYSHWVGTCWPLLEPCLTRSCGTDPQGTSTDSSAVIQDLYDREGLVRFILSCGQDHSARGGMRDKPTTRSDSYHTCYVLNGLSSAQYVRILCKSATKKDEEEISEEELEWDTLPLDDLELFNQEDLLAPLDPVYAIPEGRKEDIMEYYQYKSQF